jgi:hypothetical protein
VVILTLMGHVSLAETTEKCCCWYSMALGFRLHLAQAQNEARSKGVETIVCQEYRRAPTYDGVPFRRLGRKSTVSSVGNALNIHIDCIMSLFIIAVYIHGLLAAVSYLAVTQLTGHDTLRRHLHLLGLLDSPLCRRCGANEKTSAHILCECEAVASLRHVYLGSFFLEPEDIKSINLGAIWNFSKVTGPP